MKAFSLLLLRLSLGMLMLVWGLDKLVDVEHAVRVSERFYLGLFDSVPLLRGFGALQCLLGLLVAAGLLRRFAYPALLAITGATLLGVRRSIVDPWGWVLEGTNALFFPSLIVFAAALVLLAFRAEDLLSLDARRARRRVWSLPPASRPVVRI
jgi:putative oxidoreductase